MRLLTFVPIILLATALPLVAAERSATGEFAFDSPKLINAKADGTLTGDDASQTRAAMDGYPGIGNHDGTVQASEVDAFEAFVLGAASQSDDDSTYGSSLTVDGKAPNDVRLVEFELRNAEGPVGSTSAVDTHLLVQVSFDVKPAQKHTVVIKRDDDGGSGFTSMDVDSATLKAPKGYVVESAMGLPSTAKVSGDKKQIVFDGNFEPAGTQITIVFDKRGGVAPGLGVVALVGVAAVVAAARRRPHG